MAEAKYVGQHKEGDVVANVGNHPKTKKTCSAPAEYGPGGAAAAAAQEAVAAAAAITA